jgi:hypothetical protein
MPALRFSSQRRGSAFVFFGKLQRCFAALPRKSRHSRESGNPVRLPEVDPRLRGANGSTFISWGGPRVAHTLFCMYAPRFWRGQRDALRGGDVGKQCRHHAHEQPGRNSLTRPAPRQGASGSRATPHPRGGGPAVSTFVVRLGVCAKGERCGYSQQFGGAEH